MGAIRGAGRKVLEGRGRRSERSIGNSRSLCRKRLQRNGFMRSLVFAETVGSRVAPVRADRPRAGMRQKSAGLRTYTLVGAVSALIILISKCGFTNILADGRVVLDPSRMAAQIVSGIGFIGGGVIFVCKDLVRGLATATTIGVTSVVGMVPGRRLLRCGRARRFLPQAECLNRNRRSSYRQVNQRRVCIGVPVDRRRT